MDKVEKIKFSLTLPTDLIIKVDMFAQEKKIKYRTDALKIIIENFFENFNNENTIEETIDEIKLRLDEVEKKIMGH